MQSFSDIIDRWESAEAFAKDVGVSGTLARLWKHRNRIPDSHWLNVEAAATGRGFDEISVQFMAQLAANGGRLPEAA